MKTYLRIESVAILAAAVALNWFLQGNWWLFALFAVLPDLTLLAYLGRGRSAVWPNLLYNIIHMYAAPILFGILFWPYRPYFLLGWVAHIAVDRTIGFGFKAMNRQWASPARGEDATAP